MILEVFILTIILTLNLFIAVGVLYGDGKEEFKKRILFVLMISGIILWVITILITDLFYKNTTVSLWASRGSFASTAFLSIFYILFAYSFHKKLSFVEKFLSIMFVGLSIIAIFVSFTDFVVKEVNVVDDLLKSTFGSLYLPFGVYAIAIFSYPSIILYRAFKKEENKVVKMQIKYILMGTVTSVTASLFTNLVLPMLGAGEIRFLGPLTLVFFLGATYYAILRYRFLSVRYFVGRLVYITFLITVPYFFFYGIYAVQNKVWGSIFSTGAYVSGILVSALFVFILFNTSKRVSKFVTEAIISPDYIPEKVKENFVRTVSVELDVNKIVNAVISTFNNIFKLPNIGIVILDKKGNGDDYCKFSGFDDLCKEGKESMYVLMNFIQNGHNQVSIREEIEKNGLRTKDKGYDKVLSIMKEKGIEVIIPFDKKTHLNGYIFLGKKDMSSVYTVEDILAYEGIVISASVALSRAMLYSEVQNFSKTLQQKVDQQTVKLRDNISELKEAQQRERDILDVLGHELRTPLSIIQNALGLIEMKGKAGQLKLEDVKTYVEKGKESVRREIDIVENMLSATKISSGQVMFNNVSIDMIDVVEDSIDGNIKKAEEKNLHIKFEKPKDVENFPKGFGDRTATQRVMDNLLSNAVKYTDQGGIDISVDTNAEYVTIHVQDTGKGIPENEIKNLGQKFYRLDQYLGESQDRGLKMVRPGGTGIGLYVVFGLVREMKGKIWVYSEVGKGSTFHFALPIFKGQEVENKGEQEADVFKRLGLKK